MFCFDGLLEEIEQADIITIFRHVHPDCDAVGSQFGLKNWLLENYPDKKVYALGKEYCTQGNCWPASDVPGREELKESLALVVDTADEERIDDDSFELARRLIKIDHHPNRSPYGQRMYVFETSASTCEILAEFFRQSGKEMSQKTAEYLYRGMLTDTLCFRTTNTQSHTLEIAGWTAQFSVRIPELNRELFDQSLRDFRFANMIRSTVKILDQKLAYRIITVKEQKEWGMTASEARNFVDEYGHVREFEIFLLITEREHNGSFVYDASLRSKTVVINGIAEKFRGGGHRNASGVKGLTRTECDELISALFASIPR